MFIGFFTRVVYMFPRISQAFLCVLVFSLVFHRIVLDFPREKYEHPGPGQIVPVSYSTINTTNCRAVGGGYSSTGWQSGYSCYFHANSTGVFIQFDAEL